MKKLTRVACSLLFLQACGSEDPSAASEEPLQARTPHQLDQHEDAVVEGAHASPKPDSSPQLPGRSEPLCETLRIGSGRVVPDMLIVLDRSGSMRSEGVDRWAPSLGGIQAITRSLQDVIRFGLMAFPGRLDCGAVDDPVLRADCIALNGNTNDASCAAGSLEVPIGLDNADALSDVLDNLAPGGATPTAVTLEAAHAFFGTGRVSPDQLSTPKYVLLVTDGAPNCSSHLLAGEGDQLALSESVAAISAMTADGIKTFVLGYDTQADPVLRDALDHMAAAGGTGDQAHRPIENEESLISAFERIAGRAISCEYALSSAPSDAAYVLIELDGVPLVHGDPDGWTLSPDHLRVTLQGAACETLSAQGQHDLAVSVQCEPVVVL